MRRKCTRRGFIKAGLAATAGAAVMGPRGAGAASRELLAGEGQAKQTWWVAADPHVAYEGYEGFLETSVKDVNNLESDYAIILGDLFEDDRAFLPQFYEEMGGLATDWTYILGNHDYDDDTGAPILPVRYFETEIAGVRVIALSDEMLEEESHRTELGKNQDRWFKQVLDEKPEAPTLIMTHHCPIADRRSVSAFDEWLAESIDDYNIVLWIVGHAHRWMIDENLEGHGFDRIKVGSICRKHGDRRPCESAMLTLEDLGEQSRISVRFRNHENEEWITVANRDVYERVVDKP